MQREARRSVSEASLLCRSKIPSKRCVSSRDLGWSSLLIDVHSGMNWDRPYTAVTTLDPRIGVHFSGNYLIHFRSRGAWRQDPYRPGTTTVLRSDDERGFRFASSRETICEFANIYLPLDMLAETVDHMRRPGQSGSVPSFNQVQFHDRAITEVTRSLMGAMDAGADELYAETVSAWLAAHILMRERSFGLEDDTRNAGEISDRRLRRVIEFVSVHYANPITLEQLAAEAGISKYHFNRLFKEKVGKSPFRFLSEVRLMAARNLLLTTDMRVSEIALACGYSAPSPFTTAFAAQYGVPPLKFRSSARDA